MALLKAKNVSHAKFTLAFFSPFVLYHIAKKCDEDEHLQL